MSGENGSHKVQILIAVLGLIGVIASGVLSNWDKLVGASPKAVQYSGAPSNRGGETTLTAQKNVASPVKAEYLAASFDCDRAVTKIEKLICGNPAISHVDGMLGQVYFRARNGLDVQARENLKLQQRRWIERRDGHIALECDMTLVVDVSCVIDFYKVRIEELASLVD